MKKMIFSLVMLVSITAMAQSDKYEAAMKKNLAQFDSMKTTADYQSLSAAFERIGDAEKTQWLPYYFSALAHQRSLPRNGHWTCDLQESSGTSWRADLGRVHTGRWNHILVYDTHRNLE